MKPEDQARAGIDAALTAAGWRVLDKADLNPSAALGVAVRHFAFVDGEADYALYADAQLIGVVEAKPAGHSLTGVETQSKGYAHTLPPGLPRHRDPLPFVYESNGEETRFTNLLDPGPRSRQVFTFHTPAELLRLVERPDQLRGRLRHLPELTVGRLWPKQLEAIRNLEKSLGANKPRALVQMATGSGKTFTACSLVDRLIRFADARRVLFLVDRRNLGRQAFGEFDTYVSPYSRLKFTEEYTVQQLTKNSLAPACRVAITTVQRLYSMLCGEPDMPGESEDRSGFEDESAGLKEALRVEYNRDLPIDTFDFIVIDECHRSIFNLWRQTLEYFDAFLIGLTATPTKQAVAFFADNLVMEYPHRQAVIDGVNVGFDVFRIRTEITEQGATLEATPEFLVLHRDRRTRAKRWKELDDDVVYGPTQLDRDVVNKSQIRLVVKTFRDCLPAIFPGREEVPKTLVFAKNVDHADHIVEIIREEFDAGNDFCQKLTYRTTGKVENLLQDFRNSFNPRILVTVDMIATGTDIKPLECLLFLRSVKSAAYFEQMKGRGVRVLSADALAGVTPSAGPKTRFVIVDAVGVCEREKSESCPLDRQPTVATEKLLESAGKGVVNADLAEALAARLLKLDKQLTPDEAQAAANLAGGATPAALARRLLDAADPDTQAAHAAVKFNLPPGAEPTPAQLDKAEYDLLRVALKPFHEPKLRLFLVDVNRNKEVIFDEANRDKLLAAGYDATARQRAEGLVRSFREFLDAHKDEMAALRAYYAKPFRPAEVPGREGAGRRPGTAADRGERQAGVGGVRAVGAGGGARPLGQGGGRAGAGAARPGPGDADRAVRRDRGRALPGLAGGAGGGGPDVSAGPAQMAGRPERPHRQQLPRGRGIVRVGGTAPARWVGPGGRGVRG
jgi:type I restriction enzyme R subunit